MYDDDWKPYVPVAARRRQAAHAVAKLVKKGQQTSPVVIEGRKIAKTFWGKAWCDNLERYLSDKPLRNVVDSSRGY